MNVLAIVVLTTQVVSTECEDTLAETDSPVKDCGALIAVAPCGTEFRGIVIDDVCKMTCHICQGTPGPEVPTTKKPLYDGEYTFKSSHPENDDMTTTFIATPESIEILSQVPQDCEWFGYHFFTRTMTSGDRKGSMMYTFRFDQDGQVIPRTWWVSYFGQTPENIDEMTDGNFWECTPHAEELSNGEFCQYDETRGEGDFMRTSPDFSIGARPQETEEQDLQILTTTLEDGLYTVNWRRSRYIPFDGPEIRMRFAMALRSYKDSPFENIVGHKYHGSENRYDTDIYLEPTTKTYVKNGVVQHQWINDHTVLIGGDWTWRSPPEEFEIGMSAFAEINNATVGTVLRFIYLPAVNIVKFHNESAWEQCMMGEFTTIANTSASPLNLILNQSYIGDNYFGTGVFNPISQGNQTYEIRGCLTGMKFKVFVSEKEPNLIASISNNFKSFVSFMTFLVIFA